MVDGDGRVDGEIQKWSDGHMEKEYEIVTRICSSSDKSDDKFILVVSHRCLYGCTVRGLLHFLVMKLLLDVYSLHIFQSPAGRYSS